MNLEGMATVCESQTNDQRSALTDPMIDALMSTRVIAVLPGTALIDALRVMNSAGVRHLPIFDGDRCVGLLAEIDMLRQLVTRELLRLGLTARLTVGEVCRRPAPAAPARSTRATTAQVMVAVGSDAVLVLDGIRVVGIVTATDLAASLATPVSP